MIYNNGNKVIQLGGVNQAWDASQMVYQYYKPSSGSPTPPTPVDWSSEYLTFEALESGTFKFSGNTVDYSLDDGATWISLASNTDSPTLNAGDKIMFKATLSPTSSGIGRFLSTGTFDAMGNPYSLLYGDNFQNITDLTGNNYAFNHLFFQSSGLTSAENMALPATTLSQRAYTQMFHNCTSLTTAPSTLPATTLASGCYEWMFNGCTSLITVPSTLPATTLVSSCYNGMFLNCSSLETAPELPAETLASNCYNQMFKGCSSLNYIKALFTTAPSGTAYTGGWVNGVASTGTFVKNPNASWSETGDNGIPANWTVVDA